MRYLASGFWHFRECGNSEAAVSLIRLGVLNHWLEANQEILFPHTCEYRNSGSCALKLAPDGAHRSSSILKLSPRRAELNFILKLTKREVK